MGEKKKYVLIKKLITRKFLGIMIAGSVIAGMLATPITVGAADTLAPEQKGNVVYLNGNDAEIVADPDNLDGAIVKSASQDFKVTWQKEDKDKSYVYAGSDTKANIGTVNITMRGGKLNYILGGNHKEGVVDTANITINGGFVGMVQGSSRSSVAGTLNDCTKNTTNNVNIVMNGGEVQALVPGSFGLTYVKNASVTLNNGKVGATTTPVQSGLLGGTNGKVDNLTINVHGGTTKDIALAQRTMITNKATVNVTGGNVGNIYAGSYYDDGDNADGTDNWNGWGIGYVNYGQAKAIDINIGKNAKYNNIYAGFQFLDKGKLLDKYGTFNYGGAATIDGSENIKANLVLETAPTGIKGELEKKTVSMIDSQYANTTWKVTGVTLDKTNATLKPGENVVLKATVNPDKATDKLTWTSSDNTVAAIDQNGKILAVAPGTATITVNVGGYTATCKVIVNPIKVDVPTVDISKPVDKVMVGVNDKESQNVIVDTASLLIGDIVSGKEVNSIDKKTADKVKKAIEENKTVTSEVKVQTIAENELDAKSKENIFKLVAKESNENKTTSKIVEYLDLSVLLKADGETLGTVNELNEEISFTIALPKELVKDGRKFYIVRVHDGVAQRIEIVDNGDGTGTFKTSKFSTYALVYEDTTPSINVDVTTSKDEPKDTDRVQTGDSSHIMLYASICGIAIFNIVFMYRKKMYLNK